MLKVGDHVGMIQKVLEDSQGRKNYWRLVEAPITKIVTNRNGTKYHAPKRFYPLDADEVDSNTETQEGMDGIILVDSVFGLTDKARFHAERWIEWANANPEKAVSALTGEG